VCTSVARARIEEACKSSQVADVAAEYGVNENALVRHLASHASAAAPQGTKEKARAHLAPRAARPARPRTPSPPATPATPVREQPAAAAARDDQDSPATSRSPTPPPTARAALDEIAVEIKTLLRAVNMAEGVAFADKAAAIRTALQAARLLASLTGELGATEATVASSPFFRRMLTVILDAVSGAKFAEARQAIVSALEREERGGSVREDVAA
jgi:hypothetical protein